MWKSAEFFPRQHKQILKVAFVAGISNFPDLSRDIKSLKFVQQNFQNSILLFRKKLTDIIAIQDFTLVIPIVDIK